MGKINNPRKQFQFQVTIGGLNPFLCQVVKLPDVEFDVTEHGDTNYDVKTAGRKKIGMMQIDKIFASEFPDTTFRQWIDSIQNTTTGGGLTPSEYKRTVMVEEFAADGITVLSTHEYDGCWPSKVNGRELSRKSSENTTESIELCVDEEFEF